MASEMEARQPLRDSSSRDLKHANNLLRRGFIRKVYGLLTTQLALTLVVAFALWQGGKDRIWLRSHEWLLWLSVAMTIATMCAMACCQEVCRVFPANYVLLFTFTFFEGVMVGFTGAVFTWQSLLLSAGVTVGIFFCFTVYAFNTQNDFTGYMPYLFGATAVIAVFGLVIAILAGSGVEVVWATMLWDMFGVLLFTFYIVFDTQLILGEWGGHRLSFSVDDYVFAALNLYIDIINLFLHLLSLMGERRTD